MFQNTAMPQLANNAFGGTSSAVLHLFSPRMFSNQGKRPLAYKFDGNFVDVAVDAVSHKAASQNGIRIDALVRNPNYMGALLPTFMPDHTINMQPLAHLWTFMLIVNNDKTGSGGITRAMSDNLQLYYGYFMDEPVNPLSHMGRLTINPNAALMITHKTIVNKSSQTGAYGVAARLDTVADIDVVPTQSMAALTNADIVSMLPEHLYSNVAADVNNNIVIMHDESRLFSNMNGPLDVHSRMMVPRNNIKKVLDSVADAQSSIQAYSFEGSRIDLGYDTFNGLVEQNLQDTARTVDLGLPTNMLLTFNSIMQRYNPKINRIDLPHQPRYHIQDQNVGSAKNVFSSMLATILPVIMADFVLAQISFRYNSYVNQGEGAFEWYGIAPITPMPEVELKQRINSLMFRLKSEIFSILKLQHGDFDLNINCDSTSVTYINLNFYSDTVASPEIYEVPTLLGGFNNSLVGTTAMADSNSQQIGGFINILQGNDRDIPLGNYDMSAYNNALEAHDKQQSWIEQQLLKAPENKPHPNENQDNMKFPPTNWRV